MDSVSGATAVGTAMLGTKKDQHQATHLEQTQPGIGRQPVLREKAVPGWPGGLVNSSTGGWESRGLISPC